MSSDNQHQHHQHQHNVAVSSPSPQPTINRILFWGSGSPPAWRVLLALAEKQLSFRSEQITFESGLLKTPPYLAINPRGLVPIFIDGPVKMYESLAILQYLEHFYPEKSLLPNDRRARSIALMRMEEANNLSAAAGEVIYYVRRTPPTELNEEYLVAKKDALHAELSLWESYLLGCEYLAPGSEPSLADIAFFPNLCYCVRLGLRLEQRYANLFDYFNRMCARPTVLSTWPPHWKTSPGLAILG
jgi:glutathione S-transferase